MSKTIDTLKRIPVKSDVLYEHIADTYFYQRSRHKNLKKKIGAAARQVRTRFFKIAALGAAIFLSMGFLFYARTQTPEFIQNGFNNSRIAKVIDGPVFNRSIIKKVQFRGEAKYKSRFMRDSVLLENTKKYRWADLAFDFKCPLDMSARTLSITLKGGMGGERINAVLHDSNNRSVRLSDICLSSGWRTVEMPLDRIKKDIDLTRIDHLRLESAYAGESASQMDSPISVSIYLKNITLSKTGGVKL